MESQAAAAEPRPPDTTDDDNIDHTIRAKAASEGLRLRLYKAARDDKSVDHIVEFCAGFVSWDFVTLYLDQLRVDQGRPTQSDVECAGRGIQRWDDLRTYIALDEQDVARAICITARWYNSGFPEDETGSCDHEFFIALPGGGKGDQIPEDVISKQTMELSVVGASSRFCRGMGRLMVALCLRYCDQLNSKGRNYTHIMVTLGRRNGEFNDRFAGILHSLGFLPVKVYNPSGQRVRCGGDLLAAMVLVRDESEIFLSLDRLTSNIIFYKPPPTIKGPSGESSLPGAAPESTQNSLPWLNPENSKNQPKVSPYAARGYLTNGKFDPSVFDDEDAVLYPVCTQRKKRANAPGRPDGPAKSCGRFHHPPFCQCHLAHLYAKNTSKPAMSPRAAPKKPAAGPIIQRKKPHTPAKKGACGRNGHRADCRCHLKHRQGLQSPDGVPKKKPKHHSPVKVQPVVQEKNPFRPSYSRQDGRVSWTSTCAALSSAYPPKPEESLLTEPEINHMANAVTPAPDFSKNATSCGRFHHPVGCQCHVKHKMVNAALLHANKRSPIGNNTVPVGVKEEGSAGLN